MFGVILWCDPAKQKAVIWCEDHGNLAFLSPSETGRIPDGTISVGDIVEFDVITRSNLRLAQDVRIFESAPRPSLPGSLKAIELKQPVQPGARKTADIIPFSLNARTAASPKKIDSEQRRQG